MVIYRIDEQMKQKTKRDGERITYASIQDATGLSKNTLSRIANGKGNPKIENLLALCRYFDCKLDDLVIDE